jgi:hypothetical protein
MNPNLYFEIGSGLPKEKSTKKSLDKKFIYHIIYFNKCLLHELFCDLINREGGEQDGKSYL